MNNAPQAKVNRRDGEKRGARVCNPLLSVEALGWKKTPAKPCFMELAGFLYGFD
jgi:hypothetical protein